MLKGGFAWHYATYDQRPEFARVSYFTDSHVALR